MFPACSRTASTVPSCGGTSDLSLRRLRDFVSGARRLLVIGGAGVSTESGIPDYRSEGVGLYARTDRRPMQHAEFVRSAGSRQRYWARNFVGWPLFSSHQPNPAHLTLRRWEEKGLLHWLVTQNVDALHSKAGHQGLTELHGCAHRCGGAWRWGGGGPPLSVHERWSPTDPSDGWVGRPDDALE